MKNYKYEVGDTMIIAGKMEYALVISIKESESDVKYLVEYKDMSREWVREEELNRLTSIKDREEMRAFVEHHLGMNADGIGRILKCTNVKDNSLELSYRREDNAYVVRHTLVFQSNDK
jgi:hypothetical protein